MDIPRHWRLKAQRYRLEGSVCPICGQPSFPPRPVCTHGIAQLMPVTNSITMVLPLLQNTVSDEVLSNRR